MTQTSICRSEIDPPECCTPEDICPKCESDMTIRTLRPGQYGETECWTCSHVWTVER